MNLLGEAFGVLRACGLTHSQRHFSQNWLGKCPSYYSWTKAMDADPSRDALAVFLVRLESKIVELETKEGNPLCDGVVRDANNLEAVKSAVWKSLVAKSL